MHQGLSKIKATIVCRATNEAHPGNLEVHCGGNNEQNFYNSLTCWPSRYDIACQFRAC